MKNFITAAIVVASITACQQQHAADSTQTNEFVRTGSRPVANEIWSVDERINIRKIYKHLDNNNNSELRAELQKISLQKVPGCEQKNCIIAVAVNEHGGKSMIIAREGDDPWIAEMSSLKELYLSAADRIIPVR